MVEGTPGIPYGTDGLLLTGLCEVEESMRYRRREVLSVLEPDESVVSITSFPRLGCPDFTHPQAHAKPETSASGSLYFPDEAMNQSHPRFKTLVINLRARRKRKVIINVPIFRDVNTPDPFIELAPNEESRKAMKPNHVYMDAIGFGMGCCCLQLTLQATHLEEAKKLYDQLAPMTPIALALSAASPVFRGYLTDRDCRWRVISDSVDDRTHEELGETNHLKESKFRIPKSRYDSISCYLTKNGQKYNDTPLVYDKTYYDMMVANNVEPTIARHIAHLFIRDPVILYKEKLEQSDEDTDHFENIQSTNWQTMRFKPPPGANSQIGWRVEFRPIEAQTSDFENAAYVVFITLLSRVILAYKLNFLIPISMVDENMVEAQKKDAVRESKFWFRKDIMHRSSSKEPLSTVLENRGTNSALNQQPTQPKSRCLGVFGQRNHHLHETNTTCNASRRFGSSNSNTNSSSATTAGLIDDEDVRSHATKMTINEIINGREDFVGVMPIVWHYVESLEDGSNTELISKVKHYLKFISDRASLKVKTTARMMRDFINSHPNYAHDSVVNDIVAYDLLRFMDKIGKDEIVCKELVGDMNCCDSPVQQNNESNQSVRDTNKQQHHHHHHNQGASSSSSGGSQRRAGSRNQFY